MDTLYNYTDVETEILDLWQKNNYFNDSNNKKDIYSTMLPPPNRSGKAHIGHALNGTLQDILIRYKRMNGYKINWIAGTDHSGISCQNAVSKKLQKEGKNSRNMSKEEFLQEIHKFSEEHGDIIVNQFKSLGLSCNWDKLKYTLDDSFIKLVRHVFVELYQKGLIYRGKYITNWCCKCQTVLSNEEVIHKLASQLMYHLKYKLCESESNNEYIIVATTRPETLFGDTAVAFNPTDMRYKHLIGKHCIVPLVNRKVPIITDHTVSTDFGTGLMKVTPSHDHKDYAIYKRNPDIGTLDIVDKDNNLLNEFRLVDKIKINNPECRQQVVKKLKDLNLIDKTVPYEVTNKHCYRCDTIIENHLTDQWYVSMRPLADLVDQHKDKFTFYPLTQKNTFMQWLNNIDDWCISRQIIWGHEIPVWYCQDCNHINVSESDINKCVVCQSSNLKKDTDVLDTWFSSWLWSFGTINIEEDKYPHDVIITGSDFLFFWITKMMMASLEITGNIPFKDIYLHGLIRDKEGVKMTKTIGNVVDPLEIISKFGTDALRFGLIFGDSTDHDMKLDVKIFNNGTGLCTKIWNAAKYITLKLQTIDETVSYKGNEFESLIIGELEETTKNIINCLNTYNFHAYVRAIYRLFWDVFCSTYLEKTKDDKSIPAFNVLVNCFVRIIKLMHPIVPFITEKCYQILATEIPKKPYVHYNWKVSIMIDAI